MLEWKPIDLAEDYKHSRKPILALCTHGADIKFPSTHEVSVYSAHCALTERVCDGPHIIMWGGEIEGEQGDNHYFIPSWWFRYGSNFSEVANPVIWCPLPATFSLQFSGTPFFGYNYSSH